MCGAVVCVMLVCGALVCVVQWCEWCSGMCDVGVCSAVVYKAVVSVIPFVGMLEWFRK